MAREAQTPAQRADADRAIALAERNVVRKPLLATADGPILSHAAASGDKLSEDQEVLTIADASSIVFLADIPQNDLPRIRPGQPAVVEIGGGRGPLAGRVHSILPGANPADFTGSVRIDLPRPAEHLALGLFGTARVTVGARSGALVVPDAAVLRDDVSGVSRVVVVANRRAHWVPVTVGLRQDGRTQITGDGIAPGALVAVSGMVGLPEGKAVAVRQ
jgi:RND family efflux transporter MFP subunit